jgi:hypothetical protein
MTKETLSKAKVISCEIESIKTQLNMHAKFQQALVTAKDKPEEADLFITCRVIGENTIIMSIPNQYFYLANEIYLKIIEGYRNRLIEINKELELL